MNQVTICIVYYDGHERIVCKVCPFGIKKRGKLVGMHFCAVKFEKED